MNHSLDVRCARSGLLYPTIEIRVSVTLLVPDSTLQAFGHSLHYSLTACCISFALAILLVIGHQIIAGKETRKKKLIGDFALLSPQTLWESEECQS